MKLLTVYLALAAFKFSPCDEDYKAVLSHITKQYSSEINQTHQAQLSGCGGQLQTDVKVISLSISMKCSPTLSEARLIYLDLLQRLLETLNSNRKIRPFLSEYPFIYQNVSLILEFVDEKTDLVDEEGKVSLVGYGKGNIYYVLPSSKTHRRNFYQESYQNALFLTQKIN